MDLPRTCIPDGWFAYADVVLDGDTAPLVVAGVRGIYVVAACHTAGADVVAGTPLTVDGTPLTDLVDSVERRAAALGAGIGHEVKPIIAFDGGQVREGWAGHVRVLALANLRSFLLNSVSPRITWDEFKRVRGELRQMAA